MLIHHFLKHQEKEPNESFSDFLGEHYSERLNHSHDNQNEHDSLPFKSTDCATAHISLAFVNPIQFFIPRPATLPNKISPIYSGIFYSSSVVSNIWQPPKFS